MSIVRTVTISRERCPIKHVGEVVAQRNRKLDNER